MKKNVILLTGIVLLIAVLAADGSSKDTEGKNLKKVKIYLKATDESGEVRLKMYDSNKPDNVVVDDLYTDVDPGTKIVWRRAKDSEIKSIRKVGPIDDGEILVEDATTILLNKRYRARAAEFELESGTVQKYIIKFVYKKDNKEKEIDPYLRVRPTP